MFNKNFCIQLVYILSLPGKSQRKIKTSSSFQKRRWKSPKEAYSNWNCYWRHHKSCKSIQDYRWACRTSVELSVRSSNIACDHNYGPCRWAIIVEFCNWHWFFRKKHNVGWIGNRTKVWVQSHHFWYFIHFISKIGYIWNVWSKLWHSAFKNQATWLRT